MQGQIQDFHAAHNPTVKRKMSFMCRGPERIRAWKLYRVLNALSRYLSLNCDVFGYKTGLKENTQSIKI